MLSLCSALRIATSPTTRLSLAQASSALTGIFSIRNGRERFSRAIFEEATGRGREEASFSTISPASGRSLSEGSLPKWTSLCSGTSAKPPTGWALANFRSVFLRVGRCREGQETGPSCGSLRPDEGGRRFSSSARHGGFDEPRAPSERGTRIRQLASFKRGADGLSETR